MKKTIFIIAVLSMVASCKPTTTNSVETAPAVDSTSVVVNGPVTVDTLALDSIM